MRLSPFKCSLASIVFICLMVVMCVVVLSTNNVSSSPSSSLRPKQPASSTSCQEELSSFFLNIQEESTYSQNGEDGVIQALLGRFGSDQHKYYVEFGTEQVIAHQVGQINTRFLREHQDYKGLLMDGGFENEQVNQHKEIITPSNINDLFAKYHVPREFNLLSIDIDFDDWWVWQAIDSHKYNPRVVITEYNSKLGMTENKVVNPKDPKRWTGSDHFGASFQAMKRLAAYKGYTLVYGEDMGVNLFYVRTDLLQCPGLTLKDEDIYKPPRYGNGGHPHNSDEDAHRHYIFNPDPARMPDDSYPPQPTR